MINILYANIFTYIWCNVWGFYLFIYWRKKSVYTKSKHFCFVIIFIFSCDNFLYIFSKQYWLHKTRTIGIVFCCFLYSNASWLQFEFLVLCLCHRFQEMCLKYLQGIHFIHICKTVLSHRSEFSSVQLISCCGMSDMACTTDSRALPSGLYCLYQSSAIHLYTVLIPSQHLHTEEDKRKVRNWTKTKMNAYLCAFQ